MGLFVNEGKIVDASFVEVPRQRNSKEENAKIKAGEGEDLWNDRELSIRRDATTHLREKYLLEVKDFQNKLDIGSSLDIGYSIMHISTIELLLSYSNFYEKASNDDIKRTLETLLFGYKEKLKYSNKFQGTGFTTNLFARAHIIMQLDNAFSEIFEGKAILYSGMADTELINVIDSLSYKLIK